MNKAVLVIAGASGVGKTSIASEILSGNDSFGFVRSLTTRAKRGDGHDDEYIYTDRADFAERIKAGELIEYMEYGDNLYGTPVSELERIFGEGKTPLLILDLNGVKSLREKDSDFVSVIVYIWDDINVIEKRLYARDLSEPTAEKLLSFIKRKQANIDDYISLPEISDCFDAFVRNEGIKESAEAIKNIFSEISKGKSANTEENDSVARKLSDMASQKIG